MGKRHLIITDDVATVTVTGGVEHSRDVASLSADATHRAAKEEKYEQGRAAVVADITAIDVELAAWSAYTTQQIKDSLGNVVVPALRRGLRGLVWIGDLTVGTNTDSGP